MISGGEKIKIPTISPTNVPIDFDFSSNGLPNISVYPVAQDTCDDYANIRSVNLPGGEKALRVQFFSEVEGWFKKDYAIYLEDSGNIYARRVNDTAMGVDDPTKYSLEHPKWLGAPKRIGMLIAEVVAGWESGTNTYTNTPLFKAARWLDANRAQAKEAVPADVINSFTANAGEYPVELDVINSFTASAAEYPVELDDNCSVDQPPSLGVVFMTAETTNDRVKMESASLYGKRAVKVHFRSEIHHPELGDPNSKPSPNEVDNFAPYSIYLTEEGIKVFDEKNGTQKPIQSSIADERLAVLVAGAFASVAASQTKFQYAPAILAAAKGDLHTSGKNLPAWDAFRPADAWGQYLNRLSEGEFGAPY